MQNYPIAQMNASLTTVPNRQSQSLTLADGRHLGYAEYGDPSGSPLLYFHGGGSSRLEPAYADRYARCLGIRLVSMDRPGYGRSTPMTAANWYSVGRDALALADALSISTFSVAGLSAGAPFALHLAHSTPVRVTQVVLINPSANTRDPSWRAVPRWKRMLIAVFSFRPLLRLFAVALKHKPELLSRRISKSQGWTSDEQRGFVAMVQEGLREPWGIATLCREAQQVLQTDWKLDWASIHQPVLVLCGVGDPAHAFYRALAGQHRRMRFVSIPGPHMPIVPEASWDLVGRSLVDLAARPA